MFSDCFPEAVAYRASAKIKLLYSHYAEFVGWISCDTWLFGTAPPGTRVEENMDLIESGLLSLWSSSDSELGTSDIVDKSDLVPDL